MPPFKLLRKRKLTAFWLAIEAFSTLNYRSVTYYTLTYMEVNKPYFKWQTMYKNASE